MARNREKQRKHLRCGMTKEERLKREVVEKEEKLGMYDSFGMKDPTPYQAVKNMIRRGESVVRPGLV